MHLAILGASGHGKVVADIAQSVGWRKITFFDDAWPNINENGIWPIEGSTETLLANLKDFDGVIIAIGNNQIRLQKLKQLKIERGNIISLIHPTAYVSVYAKVEAGTVVMPQAVINIDAHIGMGCIINTGATVDHDCSLFESVHVSPGANLAGGVIVKSCSWVGTGACIRQNITIGKNAVVGAGAVVVKDVADKAVVVGNPARRVRTVC